MNGSGWNRPVISYYTFGSAVERRRTPLAPLMSARVAFPALATLGAVSVATISLMSATDAGSGPPPSAQTADSRESADVAWQQLNPGAGVIPLAANATPEASLNMAVEVVPRTAQGSVLGRGEPLVVAKSREARVALVAPAKRVAVRAAPEPQAVGAGDEQLASASPPPLEATASSVKCAEGCVNNSVAASVLHDESTPYSSHRSGDLVARLDTPALVSDASSINPRELGLSTIVTAQPVGYPVENVQLASDALDDRGLSVYTDGTGMLELTLADVLASSNEEEMSSLVAATTLQPLIETASVYGVAENGAPDVRENLARVEVKDADNTVAAPAISDTGADDSGQLATNVEEFPVLGAAGGAELGFSSVIIAEDQLVSVRLGDLISLFQDKLERPLFVWMSSSSAATRFVTPETLAAAGLEVYFDPGKRQIVLGVRD